MSQYGSPPPSGEPGGDSTRVPGQRPPQGTPQNTPPGTPPPSWERPTRGPSEPDPWDQPATPPGGSPAQQTQQMPPAQPTVPSYPATAQPAQPAWDQPQQAPSYDQQPPTYDQGYASSPQQGYEQPGHQQPGPTGGERPTNAAAAEAKGLAGALLDFSFSTFVTGRIVKVVYLLGIVALALGLLGWIASAVATGSPLFIVFALVAGPIGFLVYLCLLRMTLELFLAITRMSEDIRRQVPDPGDRP